jgi:CBS domain-containing protein
MTAYKIIEIFTSEAIRWKGKPLADAVIDFVKRKKIAARCMVVRAVEGCFENGDVASSRLEILSVNMPIRITIVLPATQTECILARITEMVGDGIVGIQDIQVLSHKTQRHLIPRHVRVKDIMKSPACSVSVKTPVNQVVQILLSSHFTGVPVVDENNRPQGVISQGDLIYRAKMPLRLGILASTDPARMKGVMKFLSQLSAEKIMTRPAVCIREDRWLIDAVDLMLNKSLKRLPVTDASGELSGILSRQDIFHMTTQEQPDWQAFNRQNIQVENLYRISDIMRRDTHKVYPDTPVMDIIHVIDSDDIQRVAVVDTDGHFLGLISDKELFSAFADQTASLWELFVRNLPLKEKRKKAEMVYPDILSKTARDVMNTKCMTVLENASIDDAISIIVSLGVKRLPVVDLDGKFKGMISRDSLLRIGYG